MAWSRVRKGKYPLGWWYHKILLELFYWIEGDSKRYFNHVQRCTKYGFNIYGDKITPNKTLNKL